MNHFEIAVSVRVGTELLLIATVVRAASTDVYVNWPRDNVPGWKPHTSQHASGQYHQKSFGKAFQVQQRDKPDAKLKGTMNIIQFGVAVGEAKAVNVRCEPSKFGAVFEIREEELSTDRYKTFVYVDLAEANTESSLTFVGRIKKQQVFKDAEPWIVITLFKT